MAARVPNAPRPNQLNVKISDLAHDLMAALQEHYGLSQGSVIEMLLREECRRKGLLGPGGKLIHQPGHE